MREQEGDQQNGGSVTKSRSRLSDKTRLYTRCLRYTYVRMTGAEV